MSRRAIAAVLARDDLACGERLVALSLASFADRENRAWPGAPAAAARAALSRSRYLQARERLVARGLVSIDAKAAGRGRSSTVTLEFADAGPWWEGEINAELFEAVLGYSSARGPARLLLATMAAVSDVDGIVRDLPTDELCAAAGVADRTYRRARVSLLESGEVVLVSGVGGRGNTNEWTVADPRRRGDAAAHRAPRRVAPQAGARPLVAAARPPAGDPSILDPTVMAEEKGAHDRTVDSENRLIVTGVSAAKGGHGRMLSPPSRPVLTGVSGVKGGQDRTLFEPPQAKTPAETAAQTPAETPAANVRAGKEPQNPRTQGPPSPPAGGSPPDSLMIEQAYVTERGRRRRRAVRVDLAEVRRGLGLPAAGDYADWERIRAALLAAVGESTFAIWLEPLELIAIDGNDALVIAAPPDTGLWVRHRFGGLIAARAEGAGRALRLADETERRALVRDHGGRWSGRELDVDQKEVS